MKSDRLQIGGSALVFKSMETMTLALPLVVALGLSLKGDHSIFLHLLSDQSYVLSDPAVWAD
jgi:hypothetical protein